ncbi:Rqc2 family fibronectin-binding protein [Tuberibacillus sp. Marseille-P3662]|uniref:Rqc2 family fibronectin-binding protein n=1 Tax=Tuberibacillus sp. Marseille-P3662 TaxID=1965358 RepID=UPI000A1C86DD|nr:NFACT RNA binding domain-containing protein [Tuberibacillus sp. Marseille-P3662]
MAFDGIVTRSLVNELRDTLIGSRIGKIYQPQATDLLFQVRHFKQKFQLLLSTNAQLARMHFTEAQYQNPKEPPMFCMLLRKHLVGSIIENIEQVGYERIIHIDVKAKDEIGDTVHKRLVIELMGKHSNVILINADTGHIYDSIKHLSPAMNSYRTVLPGQTYTPPPEQNKLNPEQLDRDTILRRLDFNAGKLDQQIMQNIEGFSPLLAREVMHRAGLPRQDAVLEALMDVKQIITEQDFKPAIYHNSNSKDTFHAVNLTHIDGQADTFTSVSAMLEAFFGGKAERDTVKQKVADLTKLLTNERKKNETKLKKLTKTAQQSEKAEEYQLFGELLTAHMHRVHQGDETLEAVNYYDENQSTVTIPLDKEKSPSDNAQAYFKKYNKAKTAAQMATEQITAAEAEIDYLDRLLQQLESASLDDIEEIREELQDGGYIKRKQTQKRKNKKHRPQPEQYVSSDGTLILVGKNNKQNDHLTMKMARSDEIWLHTKDIPGSHVLIRSREASDATLNEAANLAAFYSKSKQSSSVPVDYTYVKHVRKPNGAKPGYVIYDNQKTLFVTPDESEVHRLKTNAEEPSQF